MRTPRARLSLLARAYFWLSDRFYNELAWAFDGLTRLLSGGRWASWRRAALPHIRGYRVVELGSGTGELLVELIRQGLRACGVDVSAAMLRLTRRKLRRLGLRPAGLQADARALPFPDESIDTIISVFPAGFLFEAGVLREVSRVLARRPAPGRLVVVGLCLQSPQPGVRAAMRLLFGAPPEALLADFARLCSAAGLRVIEMQPGRLDMPVPLVVAEVLPLEPIRAGSG